MKPGAVGGGLPPFTSTLHAVANAMTAPVEAASRTAPLCPGGLATMLVPNHGRHLFPFSLGSAGAALNESIPFRDAFYTV
jgi:hypothetical protein